MQRTGVKVEIGEHYSILFPSNYKEITFKGCSHLTDAHLTQLAKFPDLQTVRFERCPPITPQGLLGLKECPKLTYVEITKCNIGLQEIPKELIAFLNENQHLQTEGRLGLVRCIKVVD